MGRLLGERRAAARSHLGLDGPHLRPRRAEHHHRHRRSPPGRLVARCVDHPQPARAGPAARLDGRPLLPAAAAAPPAWSGSGRSLGASARTRTAADAERGRHLGSEELDRPSGTPGGASALAPHPGMAGRPGAARQAPAGRRHRGASPRHLGHHREGPRSQGLPRARHSRRHAPGRRRDRAGRIDAPAGDVPSRRHVPPR